jgi:hypothetical protein
MRRTAVVSVSSDTLECIRACQKARCRHTQGEGLRTSVGAQAVMLCMLSEVAAQPAILLRRTKL